MFSRYKASFAAPGAARFCAAGLVQRMPIAIYPIAIVLIISGRTGHYGLAGLVSGCYVIGGAIGNPIAGRLVDRHGQHRILPPYMVAHAISVAAFASLIIVRAPVGTLLLPALAMGFTFLNIGALVRARWSYVWPGDAPERSTAYSLESTLDEVVFVLGPLIATVLATHGPAVLVLAVALTMIIGGSIWLAAQRDTEPPVRSGDEPRAGSALRYRGMLLITATMVFMGGTFATVEVVIVAFCGQHGQRSSAGWAVACFAAGSGIAGFTYGTRHWRSPLLRRFTVSAVCFGVMPLLMLAATSVETVALCALVVGLATAPTLIGGFQLIESIVPGSSLTEGLTWISTGVSVGYGAGAALVGNIADAHGAHLAFVVPVCTAVGAAVCALLLAARARGPAEVPAVVG